MNPNLLLVCIVIMCSVEVSELCALLKAYVFYLGEKKKRKAKVKLFNLEQLKTLLVWLILCSVVKTLVLQMWLNDPLLYELVAITVGNDHEKRLQPPLIELVVLPCPSAVSRALAS